MHTNTSSVISVVIRDTCKNGLLLPLIPYENTWHPGIRAALYCAGLMYCSMGVTIVAGFFMGSIEKITSKTRKIYLSTGPDSKPEAVEVRIWNNTVANLTLMALGSSAPEILLSVMEIIGNKFNAGDLGPGTIVGSAAFNLLAITAVCIVAIPNGEVRSIKLVKVFVVTSIFCLSAYIWLLVILDYISPGVVESWEALVTLLFSPLMVTIAWWADRNFRCTSAGYITDMEQQQIQLGKVNGNLTGEGNFGNDLQFLKTPSEFVPGIYAIPGVRSPWYKLKLKRHFFTAKPKELFTKQGAVNREGLIEFYKGLRKYPDLSDSDAATLAATRLIETQPHSRMWYGIRAVRGLSGGKKIHPVLSNKLRMVYETINSAPDLPNIGPMPEKEAGFPDDRAVVEFEIATMSVPENIGEVLVNIVRHGNLEKTVTVKVESFDGTAKQGSDYLPVNEVIVFGPFAKERQVAVKIVDDNQWEPDEEFFLRLSIVSDSLEQTDAILGRLSIMEIVILDDDEPGIIAFRKRGILVKESCDFASIKVERIDGADGVVSVEWRTIDGTAKAPKDYEARSGVLVFKHREKLRHLEIPIVDAADPTKDACFEVELFNPEGGATLGRITKVAVTITNDEAFNSVLQRMMVLTTQNLKSMEIHHSTWKSQIQDALTVNGGNIDDATGFDYFMHFLTFGWKIIFSLIPPPGILGGWLCFACSLLAIGILTTIVGDLASIFGCLVGLKDTVTAITFVSLGTSLPDLFASKVAAIQETHADNAIGNVTGSNSVNVFLGLGLPWLMAAMYHEFNGGQFQVVSGALGFSVFVYSTVAFITIGLLFVRRSCAIFGKAELGGPVGAKWFSAGLLLFLWFIYILLSSLQAYDHI